MFPNHGLYWNIEVPLQSFTSNNVPCSHTQHHKNYIYILQKQNLLTLMILYQVPYK